jgi:PTS system cellobiose-specific IIC component
MKDSKFIEKFSQIAGAIGRQRHLGAIRDGFITIMPLMIVGSLVTLINNFPIGNGADGGKTMLKEILAEIPALKWLPTLNGAVWWGTFGLITIFAVVSISYNLAKSYESNALSAAVVTLATYLCVVPQMSQPFVTEAGEDLGGLWGNLNWSYLNSGALFVGIILTLITTEVFVRLAKSNKLIIKMPASVPPAVSKSFAALIPSIITVLVITFISALVETYAGTNFHTIASDILVSPLTKASGSFGFGLVVVLLTHLFWLFGVHGANMFEGILQTFNTNAVAQNLEIVNGGSGDILIFSKSFADAFIYMGGVGICLGLIIALFIAGKSKQNRMMARLGGAPALFNINEPIMFGLPIVLNPIYVIPFLVAPTISLIIAYVATAIGFLPPVCYVIPWTTPPIISGLLATGFAWQAPLIQLINLAISVIIYIPFVRIADKVEAKREAEIEGTSQAS